MRRLLNDCVKGKVRRYSQQRKDSMSARYCREKERVGCGGLGLGAEDSELTDSVAAKYVNEHLFDGNTVWMEDTNGVLHEADRKAMFHFVTTRKKKCQKSAAQQPNELFDFNEMFGDSAGRVHLSKDCTEKAAVILLDGTFLDRPTLDDLIGGNRFEMYIANNDVNVR